MNVDITDLQKQTEKYLTSFLAVNHVKISIVDMAITNEKQLEEWLSKISLRKNIIYVPIIDGSVLKGHLEIGKKLNREGFSQKEIEKIKEWAAALSKKLSAIYV